MSKKIKPLQDRVLIKQLQQETQTASGIFLPESAAEKPTQGKVIAVGEGKINDDGKCRPISVKVGDIVLYGQYAGQKVKVDQEEYIIAREEDIMAIVQE